MLPGVRTGLRSRRGRHRKAAVISAIAARYITVGARKYSGSRCRRRNCETDRSGVSSPAETAAPRTPQLT